MPETVGKKLLKMIINNLIYLSNKNEDLSSILEISVIKVR